MSRSKSLVGRLREKPWLVHYLPAEQRPEFRPPSGVVALPSQRVGMYVFLVVVASLFGLFAVSYQLRMDYQDWRPVTEPWQLWMNTGSLLIASVALQLASRAANLDTTESSEKCRSWLLVAGLCTLLFIAGQLWAWLAMNAQGNFVASNPASSFFFLITGVHGVHIIGGLVAWLRIFANLRSGIQGSDSGNAAIAIKLCATYWHFLFVVWLLLFYMLLVS